MSKGSDLPLDVLTNILSRLPRKSLKRFECVSKSWCDLIKSDYLSNLHIRNFPDQYYTNRDLFDVHAVLSNFSRPQGGVYLSFIELNRIGKVADYFDVFFRPWNPSGPLNLSNYYKSRECRDVEVSGPRIGMYCLYDRRGRQEQITLMRSSFKEVSFKEFKVVPQPSILWPPGEIDGVTTVAEIGFDPKTNDYKVVLYRQWYERGNRRHQAAAVLFSLNTNSWRKINDVDRLNVKILPSYSASISVPYVNENIHWLALEKEEERHIIVSFDMVGEVFRKFNIPPNIGIDSHHQPSPTLAVYKEYLSLIVYPPYGPYRRQNSSELDIWIMQDYGNDESWTKKYSISVPVGQYSDHVLGFWQNDEQIFLNSMRTTRLYDLRTQQILKSFNTACSDCKCRVYSESLVPIELRGHQFMC